MPVVRVRCYAELNDRLPSARKMVPFSIDIGDGGSINEMIEAIGIPAAEVDLVLVNGESVPLSHRLQHGDMVSLYPVFESFDISRLTRVRERPLRQPRFVLDVHLGKLASHLRMLGFDALYRNDFSDIDLLSISTEEHRALLSKDRKLLEGATRAYCVHASDPREQLLEVLHRFDLFHEIAPFTRCMVCNAVLRKVDKTAIIDRLPQKVKDAFDEFQLCPGCSRIYWKGGHYQRMNALMEALLHAEERR